MEYCLAALIQYLRFLGIPVETWILEYKGKRIFHELHPYIYPCPYTNGKHDDSDHPIKFSDTWQCNFLKRDKFSFRTLGTKMNKIGSTTKMLESICDFHLSCCYLQLSSTNDPNFGLTSPKYVYSHDQVPIKLADSHQKKLDTTGVSEVYNAVLNDADMTCFCTLNLLGYQKLHTDGKNYLKVHIVFKGKFQEGKDWHNQEEAKGGIRMWFFHSNPKPGLMQRPTYMGLRKCWDQSMHIWRRKNRVCSELYSKKTYHVIKQMPPLTSGVVFSNVLRPLSLCHLT